MQVLSMLALSVLYQLLTAVRWGYKYNRLKLRLRSAVLEQHMGLQEQLLKGDRLCLRLFLNDWALVWASLVFPFS